MKSYEIANVGIVSISLAWINSKISYITKNITQLEMRLSENQLNFNLIDKSIKLLEYPFEEIFRNIKNDAFLPHTELKSYSLNTIEKSQLEITEKIEDLVSKVTGQQLIVWENILFLINKIILILLIIVFLYRPDFVSVNFFNNKLSLCLVLLGLDTDILKYYYKKLLYTFFLYIIFDIIWFFYHLRVNTIY